MEEAMINQDEVFVITEEDILTPGGRKKGEKKTPLSLAKGGRAERAAAAETVAEAPAPRRRPVVRGPAGPAAASTLSLFVWGLGQLYNGQTRVATLFILCELLILSFHYLLYMTWEQIRTFAHLFFVSEWELMLYASSIDFCVILFLIYNVAHAYRSAEARTGRFEGLRRPVVAGLASALIPGWGQLLNGQLGKAAFFLFSFLAQVYLLVLYLHSPFMRILADLNLLDPGALLLNKARLAGMAILFGGALLWSLSAYDAVIVAHHGRPRTA
jgi:TM2 domain-containing membrane protein YozV